MKRRFTDLEPSEPRITYAPTYVLDNCKLVQPDGYAHTALKALGWNELLVDGIYVLMQAPLQVVDTFNHAVID